MLLAEYHSDGLCSSGVAFPSPLKLFCVHCCELVSLPANRNVYKAHGIVNIEGSLRLIKAALAAIMLFFMVTACGKHDIQTSAQLLFRTHQLI